MGKVHRLTKLFGRTVQALTLLAFLTAAVFVIPGLFGIRRYIVLSGSREPAIHTGAVAFIDTRDQDCEPGEIVTYRLSGKDGDVFVTHRVEAVSGGVYITKGDANQVSDLSPVRQDQIVGKYRFQIPFAGYLAGRWDRRAFLAAALWIGVLKGMAAAVEAASPGRSRE